MTTQFVQVPHKTWTLPRTTGRLAGLGLLAAVAIMGVAAGVARLLVGMGATTNLNDAYPWGIWIGFDFALIAFSGAGFTMAAVVHVLHLHQFESALRPALFAGLFGYVAVLLLLVLDLGRPDRFYHFLLYWNLHSPLFEISWCVLLYSTVLMLEVSPTVLEWLGWHRVRRWMMAALGPVCIIGVTLSTLHQSTLGTLYVNMPYRLHPLWHTAYLPGLFFVSSVMVGLSVAILAYNMAACVHRQCSDVKLVQGLSIGVSGAAIIYLIFRFTQLVLEGKFALALMPTTAAFALWLELGLGVALPVILFIVGWWRSYRWVYWVAPILVVLGVGMNRFNATLTGQSPAWSGVYTPHMLEWFSTLGILAAALLMWLLAVRFFAQFDESPQSSVSHVADAKLR